MNMCLAVPGKVIEIEKGNGVIEIMGVTREISLELLKDIKVGDYVLVHAGCAIEKMDEEEAIRTIELFNELEEIVHE